MAVAFHSLEERLCARRRLRCNTDSLEEPEGARPSRPLFRPSGICRVGFRRQFFAAFVGPHRRHRRAHDFGGFPDIGQARSCLRSGISAFQGYKRVE